MQRRRIYPLAHARFHHVTVQLSKLMPPEPAIVHGWTSRSPAGKAPDAYTPRGAVNRANATAAPGSADRCSARIGWPSEMLRVRRRTHD